MKLSQINEAFDHRIVGGSEYQWDCYPDARFLDFESDYAHASVLFDTVAQTVYEVTINDKENNHKPYRWINPEYKDAYLSEAKTKGVDPYQAWDKVKWVDLEVENDFLEKATAIFFGDEFDDRVQVPINMDKEELYRLMELAHERDITLNELVQDILLEMFEKEERRKIEDDYVSLFDED